MRTWTAEGKQVSSERDQPNRGTLRSRSAAFPGPGLISLLRHASEKCPRAPAAVWQFREPWRVLSTAAAYNNRGNLWSHKGNVDAALKDYNEAIRLNPKEARAYNNRGEVWFDKGDVDATLIDYAEAIRLDPSDVDAYNNRSPLLSTTPDDRIRNGR